MQSYKAQFLLAQQRQQQQQQQQQQLHTKEKKATTITSVSKPETRGTTLTREESLMSIADAICPPGLRLETVTELPGDHNHATATRRGHSVSFRMTTLFAACRFPLIQSHFALPFFYSSVGQIVMDIAKIIGCQSEGVERSASASASCGLGRSVRQHFGDSCAGGWMGKGGVGAVL